MSLYISNCQFLTNSSLYLSSMMTIGIWMYSGSGVPSSVKSASQESNAPVT